MLSIFDMDLYRKKVLIRADLNVPIKNGVIMSTTRIDLSLECVRYALSCGAAVLLMSHLGRPIEGQYDAQFSLEPVYDYLKKQLDCPVFFSADYLSGIDVQYNSVCLLENVRFNEGEQENSIALSEQYSSLADILVMDAFGTCHRSQASTYGAFLYCDYICAGPLLLKEIEALKTAMHAPQRPLIAVVGGAKVSTKFDILLSLSKMVDQIIVGGGIANTFLVAQGYDVGQSLYEADWVESAAQLMETCSILTPVDVCVAQSFSKDAEASLKDLNMISASDFILDVGPKSIVNIQDAIMSSQTIIWNGPVGVFEFDSFSKGTESLAQAIDSSLAYSLAGGGDTLAAIEKYHLKNISYISSGGGSFLEFIEGRSFPILELLSN